MKNEILTAKKALELSKPWRNTGHLTSISWDFSVLFINHESLIARGTKSYKCFGTML